MKYLIIISLLLVPAITLAVAPQPTCEVGYYEGTYDSDTDEWTGKCVIKSASTSFVHFLPKIKIGFFDRTITWLNTHFMESRIVIGQVSQPFAVSTYGTPYYGNYLTAMFNPLQGTNYGYEYSINGIEGKWTAGSINLNMPSGTYYARVISDYLGLREIVSPEIMIEL